MINKRVILLAALLGILALLMTMNFHPSGSILESQHAEKTHLTTIISNVKDGTLCPKTPRKTSAIDWNKRFRFVPNNVGTCSDLFKGDAKTLPQSFRDQFNNYMDDFRNITSRIKNLGHIEGYTARIPEAHRTYIEIASHPSVKTICETGFNGGHSTFSWLATNPVAHVYSFDLGKHNYSRPMAEHISTLYPGRFDVTWGDSQNTLPAFRREHPNLTCDVIIIDGGHSTDICRSDFVNFKQMASVDNVVIMDNYPQNSLGFMTKLGDCWEWAKRNAEVAEIFNCQVPEGKGFKDFGFSVGRMPVD